MCMYICMYTYTVSNIDIEIEIDEEIKLHRCIGSNPKITTAVGSIARLIAALSWPCPE